MKNYKLKIKTITFCLILTVLTACKEQVMHNLSEQEANRLVSKLHELKIDAEKVRQPDLKWSLSVPSDQAIKAIDQINNLRLVREPSEQVAQKSSLVSSPDEQRFQYERNLSHEIEKTIASLSGVLEARVHLNLPVNDPFMHSSSKEQSNKEASGSVLLITEDGFLVPTSDISALVGGAAGIPSSKITVLIRSTATVPTPAAPSQQLVPNPVQTEATQAPILVSSKELSSFKLEFNWQQVLQGLLGVAVFIGAFLLIRQRSRKNQIKNLVINHGP